MSIAPYQIILSDGTIMDNTVGHLYPYAVMDLSRIEVERTFDCLDCGFRQSYIYLEYKLDGIPKNCAECDGKLKLICEK